MAGLDQRPALPVGALYTKDGSIVGFAISNATVEELADASTTINRMLAEGKPEERVTKVMPLSEASEAHRLVEGHAPGRVVLTP